MRFCYWRLSEQFCLCLRRDSLWTVILSLIKGGVWLCFFWMFLIYLKLKKISSDNLSFRTSNCLVCIVKPRDYWVLLFWGKQCRCDGELRALQVYNKEIRTSMLMARSGSSRMDPQPTYCVSQCMFWGRFFPGRPISNRGAFHGQHDRQI